MPFPCSPQSALSDTLGNTGLKYVQSPALVTWDSNKRGEESPDAMEGFARGTSSAQSPPSPALYPCHSHHLAWICSVGPNLNYPTPFLCMGT